MIPQRLRRRHQHLVARRRGVPAVGALRRRQGRDRQGHAATRRSSCSPHGVAVVSLWPGLVLTEGLLANTVLTEDGRRELHGLDIELRRDAEVQRQGGRRARGRSRHPRTHRRFVLDRATWRASTASPRTTGHLPPETPERHASPSMGDDIPDYWQRRRARPSAELDPEADIVLDARTRREEPHDVRPPHPDLRRRPRRPAGRRVPRRTSTPDVPRRVRPLPAGAGKRGASSATDPMGLQGRRRARPRAVRGGDGRHLSPPGGDRRGGALGVFDSDVRNAELERQGIVAEVLFADFQNSNEPPWGAAFPFPDTTPAPRLAGAPRSSTAGWPTSAAGSRAAAPAWPSCSPTTSRPRSREVQWCGRPGWRASCCRPATGTSSLPRPVLRPALGGVRRAPVLPVTFHSGGTPWQGYGPHAMWVTEVRVHVVGPAPALAAVFGGVFERFPDLQVAFTEQGADWIPSMLERMDEQYQLPVRARDHRASLTKSPSGYWHRNCYVGASFMSRAECDVRERIGVDRIMWGADYPHIEGTWPHSLGRPARGRQRLHARGDPADGERDRRRRLRLRPRRAPTRSPTRIGPRLDDLVTPATPPRPPTPRPTTRSAR